MNPLQGQAIANKHSIDRTSTPLDSVLVQQLSTVVQQRCALEQYFDSLSTALIIEAGDYYYNENGSLVLTKVIDNTIAEKFFEEKHRGATLLAKIEALYDAYLLLIPHPSQRKKINNNNRVLWHYKRLKKKNITWKEFLFMAYIIDLKTPITTTLALQQLKQYKALFKDIEHSVLKYAL